MAASEEAHHTLTVSRLGRTLNEGVYIHSNISFSLRSGEILFVRGPSGWVAPLVFSWCWLGSTVDQSALRAFRVGKTLLLRSLAYLDPFDEGSLRLDGQSPEELGVPK